MQMHDVNGELIYL